MNRAEGTCRTSKLTSIHVLGIPEGENGAEILFEEIMPENVPKFDGRHEC